MALNQNQPTRNRNPYQGVSFDDFDTVRLMVATREDILNWSHGEVLKPETINYRTQRPEKDGLFCEKIFGPEKDINPHDSRFKGVRSREAAVDKNGALVTKAIVRRSRMGHIGLAAPIVHTWFLKTNPSPLAQISGLKVKELERIIYYRDRLLLTINRDPLKKYYKQLSDQIDKVRHQIVDLQEAAEKAPLTATELERLNDLNTTVVDKEIDRDLVGMIIEQPIHTLLPESTYQELPPEVKKQIKAEMGGEAVYKMLLAIDLDDLTSQIEAEIKQTNSYQIKQECRHRLRIIQGIAKAAIKIEDMCLTALPVIPPDLRPIIHLQNGRFATSDLNDLYRRVINRNNRLKNLIELDAPDIICLNEKRMLQESVDALIDNSAQRSSSPPVTAAAKNRKLKSLTDYLKGKHGRFRQNSLGKRVDYSGRSVIISGPRLKASECGLPKVMALELFKAAVVGELISRDLAANIRAAIRLIDSGDGVVWDALDRVIEGKYVLLNRQPTLHRLSVQAFLPRLIEGKAIQLPPLVCKGFNADFDGDTMSVHLPLSAEAQAEARDLMTPSHNLLHPANGRPILYLDQDVVVGLYFLTYERYPDEPERHFADSGTAMVAYDHDQIKLQTPIALIYRGQLQKTTLGRILLNEVFPNDFPFQDRVLTKNAIGELMALVYRSYDSETTLEIADRLKDLAFAAATDSGLSIGMNDFMDIVGVDAVQAAGLNKAAAINRNHSLGLINEAERYRLIVQNLASVDDQVLDLVNDQFHQKQSALKLIVDSEARGKINIDQVKQMTAAVGVQSDAVGQPIELPVNSSYYRGLRTIEYFIAARGGRKSMADIALKTADAGYLTRRLVYVAQNVFTAAIEPGPEVDPGFWVSRADSEAIGFPLANRLVGRYMAADLKVGDQLLGRRGDLITMDIANQVEASDLDGVLILSVLSNRNYEFVPQKCYGIDLGYDKLVQPNHAIGVIAAQSIGEPSTQLKLDSKHSGGVASVSSSPVNTGLDRVIELFDARQPKGLGFLATIEGTVAIVTRPDGGHQITIQPDPDQPQVVKLRGNLVGPDSVLVKVGDEVRYNQPLLLAIDWSVRLAPAAGKVVGIERSSTAADVAVLIQPSSLGVDVHQVSANRKILVKHGQTVKRGQALTSGSFALDKLLATRGVTETQRYILNEASNVFISQDKNFIADKHFEVIIRQMFSQVKIVDSGDSEFLNGDFVSRYSLEIANQELVAAGKQPATWVQLVLGLAKVGVLSDSFLAAASFQNTTQILVGSSIRGRIDHLRGLTENVILGRKIPVGTGAPEAPSVALETESE